MDSDVRYARQAALCEPKTNSELAHLPPLLGGSPVYSAQLPLGTPAVR